MKPFFFRFLLIYVIATLVGCGVPGVPKPPSLDLPQPVTDLRPLRKGDSVFLEWTVPAETTDHLAVRKPGQTLICRSTNAVIGDCTNPVARVAPPQLTAGNHKKTKPAKHSAKLTANYADNLPSAILQENTAARFFYAVSVLNENGRSAGISNIAEVPALPALPPPSDFAAKVTAEGVVLSWTATVAAPAIPGVEYLYRIYRRPDGETADTVVGEVPLVPSVMQMLDHSFEWEKAYSYRATAVTRIHEAGKPDTQFEGSDSPAVKIFTHDVFPPAVPSGLQAVFSGAGQRPFIDLIWAPDVEADLAGYNVYRRETPGESVKINTEPVKTPAFRDMNVTSAETYFYSVSAVDVRGNESARSQETSESVP